MKFEKQDLERFISLVTGEEGVTVCTSKKDTVIYRCNKDSRKNIKRNLHSLTVEALAKLSKSMHVTIRIAGSSCIFKLNKFKMEANISEWNNAIIFITLLKLSKGD